MLLRWPRRYPRACLTLPRLVSCVIPWLAIVFDAVGALPAANCMSYTIGIVFDAVGALSAASCVYYNV